MKQLFKNVDIDKLSLDFEENDNKSTGFKKPVKTTKIKQPNNAYCRQHAHLFLKKDPSGGFFTTAIGNGGLKLKTSTRFKFMMGKELNQIKFFLKEKTWSNSKILNINGEQVIVPDKEFSTTLLEIPSGKGGESFVASVEGGDEQTQVEYGPEFEIKTPNGTRHGRMVSHSGTIYVTFTRKGGLSIEESPDVIVSIDRKGTSSIIH